MGGWTRRSGQAEAALRAHVRQARIGASIRIFFADAFAPGPRNVLHWLSWAIALAVEVAFVALLHDGHIYAWEVRLTREAQEASVGELAFLLTATITNTLSLGFVLAWALIVVASFVSHRVVTGLLLFATFPLHVLAQFPKAIVDRERPSDAFPGLEGVGGAQSFPSGHAEFVVSFYGLLAYLACRHLESTRVRLLVVTGWLLVVVLTGFGRLAEGRHWPLDVLVSYAVGAGLLSGLIWLDTSLRRTAVRIRALEAAA